MHCEESRPSLLIGGSVQEIDLQVKKLLTEMKKAAGFIFTLPFNAIGPAKIENVLAMTEAVHRYGGYTNRERRSIMIDLTSLTSAVGELDEKKVMSMLQEFVAGAPETEEAAQAITACQKGMEKVGQRFETGEYFVGDLIFAGELLTEAMEVLKPIIGSAARQKVGKIVLGTVQGDLHNIGKIIFKSMAEAAGFTVYDLGINVSPEAFLDKIKEVQPDILGLSGVLTMAVESMKKLLTCKRSRTERAYQNHDRRRMCKL